MIFVRFENPIKVETFETVGDIEFPRLTAGDIETIIQQLVENVPMAFPAEDDALSKFCTLNKKWLDPDYQFRQQALAILPKLTGFSQAMIETFGFHPFTWESFTPPPEKAIANLEPWQDGYVKSIGIENQESFSPEIITRILFGNVVGFDALTLVQGFAAKCPQIIKVASGQPLFAFIYGDSMEAEFPDLRSTMFLCYWKGGDRDIENQLFEQSSLIDVWGADETVADIQQRVSGMNNRPRITENPHRIGMSFISKECLTAQIADLAAVDITCWSGMACFSVKHIFIEGTFEDAKNFGHDLSRAVGRCVKYFGTFSDKVIGIEMRRLKNGYEQLEYEGKQLVAFSPSKGVKWIVVVDGRDMNELDTLQTTTPLAPSCIVHPVTNLETAVSWLERQKNLTHFFEEASVAISNDNLIPFGEKLIDAGFMNIKCIGSNAFPKEWEPHGGSFYMATAVKSDNLRWTCIDTRDIDAEIENNLQRVKDWNMGT